jgi:hypothetical protein
MYHKCKYTKKEIIQTNNLQKFEKIQRNNSAKIEKIQRNILKPACVVAVDAIRAISHQMLGAWGNFVSKSVHGISLAMLAHIYDSPNTHRQSAKHHQNGHRRP